MNRHSQRRVSPVEQVQVRIILKTEKELASKMRGRIPGARMNEGNVELLINGKSPSEVVKKAKASLEMARKSIGPRKTLSRESGRRG